VRKQGATQSAQAVFPKGKAFTAEGAKINVSKVEWLNNVIRLSQKRLWTTIACQKDKRL